MADDVCGADVQLLEHRRGIFRHRAICKTTCLVRAIAMPPLIDADYGAERRKVGFLLGETVVEEAEPTVQKHDRRAAARHLDIELRPVDVVEAAGVRSPDGRRRGDA